MKDSDHPLVAHREFLKKLNLRIILIGSFSYTHIVRLGYMRKDSSRILSTQT